MNTRSSANELRDPLVTKRLSTHAIGTRPAELADDLVPIRPQRRDGAG